MNRNIIFIIFLSFFVLPSFALEAELTKEQILEKKIQIQVDSGLGTIKTFLSEKGVCKDILNNKTIATWYTSFIDEIARPMENRKMIFEQQSTPLTQQIDLLKAEIQEKNTLLRAEKEAFLNEYIITNNNETILEKMDILKKEILEKTSTMNIKLLELKNIQDEYEKQLVWTRSEVANSYETKIYKHCEDWYGKVELTDKKTLEQVESDLTISVSTVKKTPSKYKKVFDKINVLYVKKPKSVEALYTRLDKVVRKLSKTHKDYEFIFELRKHIQTLLAE